MGAACLAATLAAGGVAGASTPVVRAVLFYLPSCGHCHQVMTVDLPPLLAAHGDALQIATVDVSLEQGAAVYEAAVAQFGLESRRGVPMLIVGDVALVGSAEIPERFATLVDELLAAGGADWPDIPGLAAALGAAASADPTSPSGPQSTSPASTASPSPVAAAASPDRASPGPMPSTAAPLIPDDDPLERLGRDPVGNGLALVVLGAMLAVLGWAVVIAVRTGAALVARPPSRLIVVLAVAGLGVAAYLAYVETTATAAVCGPVGDCNTVQQSEFARLAGLVPIGVLGLAAYAAILGAWILGTRGAPDVAGIARMALIVMALAGTAFSVYLTFLEPFVIGATCAWCLTSAVLMTGILVIAIRSMRGSRISLPGAVP